MISTLSNIYRLFALLSLKTCHAIILFDFLIILVILQTILYFTPGEMAFMKTLYQTADFSKRSLILQVRILKKSTEKELTWSMEIPRRISNQTIVYFIFKTCLQLVIVKSLICAHSAEVFSKLCASCLNYCTVGFSELISNGTM